MTKEVEREVLELEDTQKDKYLTFFIGNENYGIAIGHVIEIIGIQPITEVPEMPECMKGIINLRGKITPVMDVRLRFKKPPAPYNDRTCIIVIHVRELSVGLIVDRVAEVVSISESDIADPPELHQGSSQYIKGFGKVGSDVKLLLDCHLLFHEDDEILRCGTKEEQV